MRTHTAVLADTAVLSDTAVRTDTVTRQRAHPTVAVLVDILLAAGIVALGVLVRRTDADSPAKIAVLLGAALVAAAARRWPAAALVGIWLVALAQVELDGSVLATTLSVATVGFRCARYGSRPTLLAAGASIPVGSVVALVLARDHPSGVSQVAALANAFGGYSLGVVGGFVTVAAVLAVPFTAGLVLRVNERYRRSVVARELAESRADAEREIARSRAAQTLLTRDVHDVVGHSLAVIIAQADSAQAHAERADDTVRAALAQIAGVGRSSLAEIRSVLARTSDASHPQSARDDLGGDLAELIAGVRTAGHAVDEVVAGGVQPLGADARTATYRVLQELLTNALKHGRPGPPIAVTRTWSPDGLTLRVENAVVGCRPGSEGMGLAGVRSRLAAVDGTFETSVVGDVPDLRFVATAYVPVRR